MTADTADTTGEGFPPIPDHVRALADAAASAATKPASHRIACRYLVWLEQEAAATRRLVGLDTPHRMANGREVYFTPVDADVHRQMAHEPHPLPRAVGVLSLIGLLETV